MFDKSYCKDKMIEKGISKDRAEKLSDIIGPYACIWEVENGDDPYESMRSRLKDKASYLDGEDLIMENYDDEEDEEDGEIDRKLQNNSGSQKEEG